MAGDLVERLRDGWMSPDKNEEAANEIERLIKDLVSCRLAYDALEKKKLEAQSRLSTIEQETREACAKIADARFAENERDAAECEKDDPACGRLWARAREAGTIAEDIRASHATPERGGGV